MKAIASVTAGLMWQPEILPIEYTIATTARPNAVATMPTSAPENGDASLVSRIIAGMENLAPLDEAVAPTRDAGLQVELGGELPDTAAAPMSGQRRADRHRRRAADPGARVRLGRRRRAADRGRPRRARPSARPGITLLAATMDVSTAAPMVATMVGLGVGIDYALLLVTRHVEYLRAGPRRASRPPAAPSPPPAARWSSPPRTVLVSLLGLRLAGLPTYDAFGFATAIAVVARRRPPR